MKRRNYKRFLLTLFLIIFFILPIIVVLAAGNNAPMTLNLQIPIPGMSGQSLLIDGDTIGLYISYVYRFFVGALAIVAVVMIMIGGFQWLMAAGSSERISHAKEIIFGAIIGLVLALTSYLLLYTLNPNLVQFKSLYIPPVSPIDLWPPGDGCCLMTDKQSTWGISDPLAHDYTVAKIVDNEGECNQMRGQNLNEYNYGSMGLSSYFLFLVYQFHVDEINWFPNNYPNWYYIVKHDPPPSPLPYFGDTCEMQVTTQIPQLTSPYPICSGGNPTRYIGECENNINMDCQTNDYPFCVMAIGAYEFGQCSSGCPGNQCDEDSDCLSNTCQSEICN